MCGAYVPVRRQLPLALVLRSVSLWVALACALVACVVLLGWAFDVAHLLSVVPGLPTMKITTALCFLLCSASLLALRGQQSPNAAGRVIERALATSCAALVLAIGGLCLGHYLFDYGWTFDSVVLADLPGFAPMSMATALLFILSGLALMLLASNGLPLVLAQAAALVTLLMAFLVLLSYLFGADLQRVSPFSSMAVHTAATFLVLAVGLLALRGDAAFVSEFLQETASARAGRRYLAGAILVLPLVGQLQVVGERDLQWYGSYFGSSLLTIAGIAALVALIWRHTCAGNQADRKIVGMQRVLATLSGINTLIVRVRDKNALFDEACRIAADVGQFPWVWIATVEPGRAGAQLRAQRGVPAAMAQGLQEMLALQAGSQGGAGLLRVVVDTGMPVLVHDVMDPAVAAVHERHWAQQQLGAGLRSLVALPLVIADAVVGVFVLHSEIPGFFDDDEMRLLQEMAGDISFAVNHIDKDAVLNRLAFYDPLTDLPNRALFTERLEQQLRQSARVSENVVLLLGNLRRFRHINETFGRQVGDALLRQVAARLQAAMVFPENLSRIDGDSFASFLPAGSAKSVDFRAMEQLSKAFDHPFHMDGQDVLVDATIAAAVFPADGANAEALMGNVESALRKAKASGTRFMFYEPAMNARVADSVKLEFKLRQALELGQFELHYQPKVDFDRRRVRSVEALMRWRDPDMGLVPPGQFIPLMEEIGLIGQAGAWALRQAVADIGRWRAMGLQAPRCAVNVSAIQLRDSQFVETVLDALAGFGDETSLLDLEITESLLMQDVAKTIRVLQTLREVGVDIAVDDFGTGYSSLAYLARLPINALKIDRAFVMGMGQDTQGAMIVESIISLAHALKLQVVAEGVETEAQATMLRDMGCDLMQGFLFCKAVPFDELAAMLPKID